MYRILYHMDSDGHASAGIVYRELLLTGLNPDEIVFHPINYGMPIPQTVEGDRVYLLDFSFQPEKEMLEFSKNLEGNLVWIDHHDTAIEMEKNPEIKAIKGLRRSGSGDKPVAACELTYEYFCGAPYPPIIKLVGDWDVWRHPDMSESEATKVKALQYYLRSVESDPKTEEGRNFWVRALLTPIEDILEIGLPLLEYQQKNWKSLIKNKGFTADFFGGYRAVIVNQSGNSEMFNGFFDPEKHDIMVTYQETKGDHLTVSMYTPKTDKIHLGNLAKAVGEAGDIPSGGGHAGAAGFQCGWEYFKSLFRKTGDFK